MRFVAAIAWLAYLLPQAGLSFAAEAAGREHRPCLFAAARANVASDLLADGWRGAETVAESAREGSERPAPRGLCWFDAPRVATPAAADGLGEGRRGHVRLPIRRLARADENGSGGGDPEG